MNFILKLPDSCLKALDVCANFMLWPCRHGQILWSVVVTYPVHVMHYFTSVQLPANLLRSNDAVLKLILSDAHSHAHIPSVWEPEPPTLPVRIVVGDVAVVVGSSAPLNASPREPVNNGFGGQSNIDTHGVGGHAGQILLDNERCGYAAIATAINAVIAWSQLNASLDKPDAHSTARQWNGLRYSLKAHAGQVLGDKVGRLDLTACHESHWAHYSTALVA